MTIHLIRTDDCKPDFLNNVGELLQSFNGPMKFRVWAEPVEYRKGKIRKEKTEEEDFYTQQTLREADLCAKMPELYTPRVRSLASWELFSDACQRFRKNQEIADEEYVVLITEKQNTKNWFSANLPDANPHNAFVQASEWEFYLSTDPIYPVAYLVVKQVLTAWLASKEIPALELFHPDSIGCLNDFCKNKKEILLKLRTADICTSCMQTLEYTALPEPVLQQVLAILEGIRVQMLFRQGFRKTSKPSALHITGTGKLFLTDYGNLEVKLRPLEKILYLLFLQHPDGLMLHSLTDHKQELKDLYLSISSSANLANMENSIKALTDATSNSASEKLSRIKAAFTTLLGEELAAQYIIAGEHGAPKKILLNRQLAQVTCL